MAKTKKVFILDTNVPLHDSQCVYKFQEHDIIIPIQVIEELEVHKKGYDSVNYNAREFLRFLDEKSSGHIFNGGVSLGGGRGNIKIEKTMDFDGLIKRNLKNQNVDAQIINVAYRLSSQKEYKDTQFIIVSKDVALRLKAKALGIVAQDFLAETVSNIESIFTGAMKLEVEDAVIDLLYKQKKIESFPPKTFRLLENQPLILQGKTKSALAIVEDEGLKLIVKDSYSLSSIKAKNSEQAFAMDFLLNPKLSLVALEGPAGTGKTIIALAAALKQMNEEGGLYELLYYTRQTISMGDREVGFLPGDVLEKIGPFMNAMHDNLGVISGLNEENKEAIKRLKGEQKLLIEPLPFIRGRSLNKIFFLIDEAQNLTPHEVKTIVTRAGEGTKIVLIGDTRQIDNPYLDQKSNGLSYLIEKMRGQEIFAHMHLNRSVRSHLAELAGKIL